MSQVLSFLLRLWRHSNFMKAMLIVAGLISSCVCCVAFFVIGSAAGIIPDVGATQTAEYQADQLTDQARVAIEEATAAVLALTPSSTPTPSSTDAPTATTTFTQTPTATLTPTKTSVATLTSIPTETASLPSATSQSVSVAAESALTPLENSVREVEGVINIRLASNTPMSSGGYIVYLEVDVEPGYNTTTMAEALQQASHAALIAQYGSGNVSPVEFSAILWDGEGPAIDYIWDNQDDEWRLTELSITPESAPVTRIPQTWFVSGSAQVNIRSCPSTDCEIVEVASWGDEIQVLATENDWHEVLLDSGETGYMAAYLTSQTKPSVRPTQIPQVQPTSAPVVQPSPTTAPISTLPPAVPPGPSCGGARTCPEMQSCAQAYACLAEGNSRLDADGDGVPCEDICP